MSSPFDLLGDTLTSADSASTPTSDLKKCKAVGLYFSAHWCPPCRGFTPKLADLYKKLQASRPGEFEVVFVSSDRDEASFKEYLSEMPWKALPYEARDAKAELSKRYKVRGIPSLVILDSEGETINEDGRSAILEDEEGLEFPWKPLSFHETLGTEFLAHAPDGGDVKCGAEAIAGKKLALYFSAHWCPPCRGFTPKLVETYKAMKAAGREDFEFVFVTSDRDESSFKEYFDEMPWIALPFGSKANSKLSSMFEVSGIPSLVTVDEDGTTINGNARGVAGGDPAGAAFPWNPPPVASIEDPDGINDTPALVLFVDGVDGDEREAARDALAALAKERQAARDSRHLFFESLEGGDVGEQVRKITELGSEKKPTLVLLDIPDNGGFYVCPTVPTTKADVEAFIASPGERKQLSK